MTFEDVNEGRTKSDEYFTPYPALQPLLEWIPKDRTIWECTDTSGKISSFFIGHGYQVISSSDNFLAYSEPRGDIIVTNPPYSTKTKFLEHCYRLDVPFALLLPITTLEGHTRQRLYREHGIQLILLNRRINFLPGKSGAWFAVAWFCHGLNLPHELNFSNISKENIS